jgi:hypothetical protein
MDTETDDKSNQYEHENFLFHKITGMMLGVWVVLEFAALFTAEGNIGALIGVLIAMGSLLAPLEWRAHPERYPDKIHDNWNNIWFVGSQLGYVIAFVSIAIQNGYLL